VARHAGKLSLLLLLCATGAALLRFTPPGPELLVLEAQFDGMPVGSAEPLIVTGRPGEAELLHVARTGPTEIRFGIERWGQSAQRSDPVRFQPGQRHQLHLTFPSLATTRDSAVDAGREARVEFDGKLVLTAKTSLLLRAAGDCWLGENPHQPATVAPRFSGKLWSHGRPLAGLPWLRQGWREHARSWLGAGCGQGICLLLVLGGIGWISRRGARRTTEDTVSPGPGPALPRAYWLGGIFGLALFGLLLTGGSGGLLYPEVFGSFYDAQASAILRGRLDVPPEAISGEAFQLGGASYGYFGLTPALLRLPAVIFDVGWGEWTRISLLLAVTVVVWACGGILREWHGIAGTRAWAPACFLYGLGLPAGTPLLFLGSRAYVYHEAILWGAAFALASVRATLRWMRSARGDADWGVALVLGALAVNARPTSGLFATGMLAVAALLRWWPLRRQAGRIGWREPLVGALALLAGVSFNALNALKFGSFEGAPLRLHVQYDEVRLARMGHGNFHLVNLPMGAAIYAGAVPPAWREEFPYAMLQRPRWRDYPGVKVDNIEETLSLPYSMPGLLLLILCGVYASVRDPRLRPPLLALTLAVLPMAAALGAATAHSHRYTADFVPFAAATGAAGIAWLGPAGSSRWRIPLFGGLALLVVAGCALNLATSLHYLGEKVWGVPEPHRQTYLALKAWIEGVQPPSNQ
jgi:hypothetical protein